MSDTATLLLLFTWFVPAPSCDLGEYRALTSCLQVNAGNLDIQSDKDQLCIKLLSDDLDHRQQLENFRAPSALEAVNTTSGAAPMIAVS